MSYLSFQICYQSSNIAFLLFFKFLSLSIIFHEPFVSIFFHIKLCFICVHRIFSHVKNKYGFCLLLEISPSLLILHNHLIHELYKLGTRLCLEIALPVCPLFPEEFAAHASIPFHLASAQRAYPTFTHSLFYRGP